MFVNTGAFKKLIKGAYNSSGLVVGATEDEYFFEGGFWIIRVEKDYFPKKEKAAVIELTGELPSSGRVFKAVKKCANQYLIECNPEWDIRTQFDEAEEEYCVTHAIYESGDKKVRVLQNKKNDNCKVIDEMFIKLIDFSALDTCDEGYPEGPVMLNSEHYLMYWSNEVMTLAAGIIKKEEDKELSEFLTLLGNVELKRKEIF